MKSRFSIGTKVCLNFFDEGVIKNCYIASVKFTDYGKVIYDIKILPFINSGVDEEKNIPTIIKDVDSYFVQLPFENDVDDLLNKI